MITIIHGSNILGTRTELQLLRTQYKEVISLDAKNATLTQVLEGLETATFSGDARLVILENLFSGKSKNDDIINYLLKNDFKNDLLIWEEKENKGKNLVSLAKKAKVIQLNLPTLLFKFLDGLIPHNPNLLSLYNELVEKESAELVFFMLKRQMRLLLLTFAKIDKPSDFARMLPWQMAKLTKQASFFSESKLLELYKELLKIEYEIKSGLTSMELEHKLKMFLALNFKL
ncbi:hypothetical protein HY030_00115 [Candidatus Gottesmanbacteria bacterium]|nr:hypothetical protein [Candidatus Gottesmanbacteria bacterium]